MTRRNLLAAAAATVMPLGAAGACEVRKACQPAHPDAVLLAACDRFLRIQRAWAAYCNSSGGDDIAADDPNAAMLDPLAALVEQIVVLRATTAEGHLARARCTAFGWLPQATECQDDPDDAPGDRFRAAELRDLVVMEREVVPTGAVA